VAAGAAATTDLRLRPGRESEAAALSALALRSKGHWGYDQAFLEACRSELTLTAEQAAEATVAEVGGVAAGFALLAAADPDGDAGERVGELAMLFVDPTHIGGGLGRLLLDAAVRTARDRRWSRLRVESDPGAEGFYLAAGAARVGTVPSGSVAGRELPLLELVLAPTGLVDPVDPVGSVDPVLSNASVTPSSRRRRS
jgi:GNAT superfamily N-acetyltransferase